MAAGKTTMNIDVARDGFSNALASRDIHPQQATAMLCALCSADCLTMVRNSL